MQCFFLVSKNKKFTKEKKKLEKKTSEKRKAEKRKSREKREKLESPKNGKNGVGDYLTVVQSSG